MSSNVISAQPARKERPASDSSIGRLLIDAGKLSTEDAERILRYQKEHGLVFGEAAVKLGLVGEADIQYVLARQFDYPCLRPGEGGFAPELVAAYDPFGKAVEALRALRTQLMLRWFTPDSGRKTLAVVSVGSGEGRSYVVANLAVVFSQLGERTLLIDADMRNPRQHAIFNLPNQMGLSGMLAGRNGAEAVRHIPHLIGLSVLPSGVTPPNPQELLSRPAFPEFLAEVAGRFDVILLDTPAASQYADAYSVAVKAGGGVLLGRRHHTDIKQAQALARDLGAAGASVVGSVLNTF